MKQNQKLSIEASKKDLWNVITVILRTGAVVENARAHRLSSIIEKCHEPGACGQNDL